MGFEQFSTPRAELSPADRQEQRSELYDLAIEMMDRVYSWPGLAPDAYRKLKAEEE